MAAVALGADVVIAFLDAADDQHDEALRALGERLRAGDPIHVSPSVYAEVLRSPGQAGADRVVDDFFDDIGAVVVPVDRALARRAAELRARHRGLRPPDALSLAAALAQGAELLTLDRRLRRIASEETPRAP